MKNVIKIILIFVIAIEGYSQTTVMKIQDDNGDAVKDVYYQDSDNLLDPFVGTYIYTNGATSLKITLQKKIKDYDGYKYEDLLVGEYQFIKDGIEKSNTLYKLDPNLFNGHNSIRGHYIFSNESKIWCSDCSVGEKRFKGGIFESSTANGAQLLIGRLIVNGEPAIKINVWWQMRYYNSGKGDPIPLQPSFPSGDYILIKQP